MSCKRLFLNPRYAFLKVIPGKKSVCKLHWYIYIHKYIHKWLCFHSSVIVMFETSQISPKTNRSETFHFGKSLQQKYGFNNAILSVHSDPQHCSVSIIKTAWDPRCLERADRQSSREPYTSLLSPERIVPVGILSVTLLPLELQNMTELWILFKLSQKHDLNANVPLWALLKKLLVGSYFAYLHTLRGWD